MAEAKKQQMIDAKVFFPLNSLESIANFFKQQMISESPNLAALSLITGYFEDQLTNTKSTGLNLDAEKETFPCLEWNTFEGMLGRYYELVEEKLGYLRILEIVGHQDKENNQMVAAQIRDKVKKIADFVWSFLSKSFFKDRPHLQSLYSFLNGKRLDCFGVAFVVVATAQYLGLEEIHLALSEDHAWITFGDTEEETAEVTWIGKGDEEKRGTPVNQGSAMEFKQDWLYLGGHEVKCNRMMEVAAIVSALNPGINSKTDSETVGRIQQELLWLLCKNGNLSRYPMAVCNMADLEEIEQSGNDRSIEDLFEEAIQISKNLYDDYHVYPYTYYGGYLFRNNKLAQATEMWCRASQVAARYTHSKQDEELYKDLHEIANTFFPCIVKRYRQRSTSDTRLEDIYFDTAENLINILNFYDGVCFWEQGGSTAAIHSEWAKNFTKLVSCFSLMVRNDCLKQITVSQAKQTSVLSTKQIPVSVAEQVTLPSSEQPLSSSMEQLTATPTERTTASLTEEIPVSATEDVSVSATEQIHVSPAQHVPVSATNEIPVSAMEHTPVFSTEQIPFSPREQIPVHLLKATTVPATKQDTVTATEHVPVSATETQVQNAPFPRSEKMKSLVNVIGNKKINSQAVNLHLTSHIGLKYSKISNSKRTLDAVYEKEIFSSSKRVR